MGDKRARKLERRERRQAKKRDAGYVTIDKLIALCRDCGDPFRIDKTLDSHRKGHCGASKEKIKASQKAIEDRVAAFDGTADNKLDCLGGCGRRIGVGDESYYSCEGAVLWIGCDACDEAASDKRADLYAAIRATWPEVIDAKAEAERLALEDKMKKAVEKAKKHERFVMPLRSVYAEAMGHSQVATQGLKFEVPAQAPQSPSP